MIADLKPYAEYKDSGAPWFGDVPSHWNIGRLGAVFAERGEANERKEVTDVLSLLKDIGVIPYAEKGRIGNKKSDDISRYKIVRPDDLVLNSMNVIIGSVGASRYTGCLSPVYYVLQRRDKENHPRFLELIFRHKSFQRSLVRIGNGILAHRMRIPMEKLKAEVFLAPPPVEQALIVRFLDRASGRLERAIRAKRKVIALLGEQKQVIIHRAVTRGLDLAVRLKPSGIPWLGDIPQHWDAPLLGRLITRVEQGWSPVAAEGELAQGQWAVLTLSAVRRGLFDPSAIKPVALTAIIPTGIQVADGDILLTRSNTRDRVGDVCIVRAPRARTILCDLIYRLRGRPGAFVSEFLVYQLLSRIGRGQIERDARGSSGTMPKISQRHIKSWRIVLPPLEEQKRIVEKINSDIAPVDAAGSRLEREIELLGEYRSRLIADVVTGKLDVREAALHLPKEAPPDTTGDDADLIADPDASDDAASAE